MFAALMVVWCSFTAQAEPGITLYVAPNGNDAWSGRAAAPNADGTDGPLATPAGARDAVRALKRAGAAGAGVRVEIRGGEYAVTEPLTFEPEDSGTAGAPIVYRAHGAERPTIHGGRRITGWTREGDAWVADLPEVRDDGWRFGSLWVNGERRTPARMPNAANPWGDEPEPGDTFYTVGPVVDTDPVSGEEKKSATRFRYRVGDLQPWPDLEDATVVVYHSWATSLLHVKSLDEENGIVEFTGAARWHFGYWQPDQRYFVEGIRAALDQPGEWYLDRRAGKLHYIPLPGEDMEAVEVVAPVARQLLVLAGRPAEGAFVEHLEFRGLRFHYTDFPIAPAGHSDGQAASSVNAAVEAVGARHCAIADCEVSRVANYGVWFRAGCKNNRLVRSEITDLGAGGVRIGETGDPASPDEAAERNTVDNCFIHEGGRIFREAVGAWIGRSSWNNIKRNEICDFRYTGISVGWSWGYAPSSAHHNEIEFNRVHHIGRSQLNDMGGIYTLGVSPGTVIRNNVFHDILSHPRLYGGWGIYTDEGSTDILIEDNLVYHTRTGGFHQHYGRENRVRNNIFAYSHGGQIIRSREEDHISFFFEGNIVYFNNGQLLGSTWQNGNWRMDHNVYWDTTGDPMDFRGRTLEEWRALGFDQDTLIADPLFVDPEHADFRLRPESPALAMGFRPIDTSRVGLYGDPEWVNKPRRIARAPFQPPQPPQPREIAFDFEDMAAGAVPRGIDLVAEEGEGTIRVTDETAASGSLSLKLTDAAGLQHAFNPHLAFRPELKKGRATGRFALRLGTGAVFFHEWRSGGHPYQAGPSFVVGADGSLTAAGRVLTTVPPNQWVRVEVACALGPDYDGTWELVLDFGEGGRQRFAGLPVANDAFRRLDWWGFVSNATEPTAIYLDDLELRNE